MEKSLIINGISKSFKEVKVFNRFSLSFPKGKTTCVLGPSGCGKTTLLRIIAGIILPDKGNIDDFQNKTFSFVFQEDRLLPWLTAAENIGLVLKNKLPNDTINDAIDEHLKLVKMQDYAHYYPHQLSGGMRQRISFARAFSFPSDVILLDEPFKGLDHLLKQQLMENVHAILSDDPRTVIYVTHDPEEAAIFGNKIFLLSEKPVKVIGEFEQNGPSHSTGHFINQELVNRIKEKLLIVP
ncbi:MAG TPA: hypothetical protein DDY13_01805 [Cytophagales bacterium]|jgi:NitT/TauT family transport system ATP-binding protein|nr:hypothetical protein [Cytophagales bacterium]